MDTILQDLRFAIRSLRKSPGFAAIAVLCLGLGIGANAVVFSAVNALLVRPLPFREPENVVRVWTANATTHCNHCSFGYLDYTDIRDRATKLASVAAWSNGNVNVGGIDAPERVPSTRVTASLFTTIGVNAAMGRTTRPEEDDDGRVAVLSDGLWRRAFGADPKVVGRAVTINGLPHTVIGVMPPGFAFPEAAQIFLPLSPGEETKQHREWTFLNIVARLAPGVTMKAASAQVAGIARDISRVEPKSTGISMFVEPFREDVASEVRPVMVLMLGAVGFVLLIACANVANLMLARATGRRREIAVRTALGATRWRVLRQLLTESVLLSILGGGLGVLIGIWANDGMIRLLPDTLAYWMVFAIDRTVLLWTVLVSLGTAIIFGLVPALAAASPSVSETLKEGGRGSSAGTATSRLRSSLVVTELALAVVLLAGASLMIRSFMQTQNASFGFDPSHALTFETSTQGDRYKSDTVRAEFYRSLQARLGALPGVVSVGAASQLPMMSCCSGTRYVTEGRAVRVGEEPLASFSSILPRTFTTMRTPLIEGRDFTDDDGLPGTPEVSIVNAAMARREWPGESALGKRWKSSGDSVWSTVVGVVGDVVQRRVTDEMRAQVYVPHRGSPFRSMSVVIRTAGDPRALAPLVRRELRALDSDLPIARLFTYEKVIHERLFESRIYGIMFGAFALVALLLASIGLYGVMAYGVAQRTHEIGVRMALGATAQNVIGLIVRQGTRLIVIGLVFGVPIALGVGRVMRKLLFGVSATDPVTFIGIPLLLTIVALAACVVPARRAARLHPVLALRQD